MPVLYEVLFIQFQNLGTNVYQLNGVSVQIVESSRSTLISVVRLSCTFTFFVFGLAFSLMIVSILPITWAIYFEVIARIVGRV